MKNNCSLFEMLEELEIEQIEKIREEYMKEHPNRLTYYYICQNVINSKKEQQEREDFIRIIEEVKSAQDSAATPSQGK